MLSPTGTSIPAPPRISNPGVKVSAFLDATEPVVEPWLASRVDSLEKAKSDAGASLVATAQVYRNGATARSKVLKGLGYLGLQIGVPIAFAATGPAGMVLGGIAAAALWIGGVGRQGIGELESAYHQHKLLPDALWSGMRRFDVAADRTPGTDSTAVASNPTDVAPSSADLASFLASQMDPIRHNVVFINGHGADYHLTASMPVSGVADAFQAATKATGRKADVLVMESCLMGNVEAMNALQNAAHVAVVSEEELPVGAVPVEKMMADAARQGGTPEEIGRRMIQDVAESGAPIPTMAAINLDKMGALTQSLDGLAQRLNGELAAGHKADLQAALKAGMRFPHPIDQPLERAGFHLSDLGGFLDALQSAPLSPQTKAAAKQASQALDDAVIAKSTGKHYDGASGLSFQSATGGMTKMLDRMPNADAYASVGMPASWKTFIESMSA